MALLSPRFYSSRRLVNASLNTPVVQGASGRHVHLVQWALMDLGYTFPRSTGNPNYSPDGIFGNELKQKLIEFQRAQSLPQSGKIDRETITRLDTLLRNPTYRVRLHFRSLALTPYPFSQALSDAEIVYGQYGIKIEFANGMSLGLSDDEAERFSVIGDSCEWDITTGEYFELHGMGPSVPPTDIAVYYVNQLTGAGGCGGHARNRPACTIAAQTTRWATAHEVGHVLLTSSFNPVHGPDRRNIMMEDVLNFSTTPVFTDRQIAKIRSSPCCTRI